MAESTENSASKTIRLRERAFSLRTGKTQRKMSYESIATHFFKSLCKAFSLRTQTALANHRCITNTACENAHARLLLCGLGPTPGLLLCSPHWLARELCGSCLGSWLGHVWLQASLEQSWMGYWLSSWGFSFSFSSRPARGDSHRDNRFLRLRGKPPTTWSPGLLNCTGRSH